MTEQMDKKQNKYDYLPVEGVRFPVRGKWKHMGLVQHIGWINLSRERIWIKSGYPNSDCTLNIYRVLRNGRFIGLISWDKNDKTLYRRIDLKYSDIPKEIQEAIENKRYYSGG